ncbi:Rha family transcriptional regulator [Desulfobacter sp. UBA2225]|uniref:Rha family transcriptional regulator n=1 Tax=Desulfobacter sp. UBA2225 TaxID=1961413 RepID=UPI00257FB8B4|nr:Rha family transcriptional regulator [Desulfobacter sp. UBA2225]
MDLEKQKINITATNGKLTVSSMMVAEHFEKDHKNVLRTIRQIVSELPENFSDLGRLNFEPSSYINDQNKEQPVMNMTRDGFVLLVMGFTGKRAMEWKLKYIEAFNAMEKAQKDKLYLKAALQIPIDSDLTVLLPTGEFGISSWKLAREIDQPHNALATKIHYLDIPAAFKAENFIPMGHAADHGPREDGYGITLAGLGMMGHILRSQAARAAQLKGYEQLKAVNAQKDRVETVQTQPVQSVTPRFRRADVSEKKMLALKGLISVWAWIENTTAENLEAELCAFMQITNLKGITTSSYENAMEYIWSGIQTLQNDFIDLCTEDELQPLRGLFDFMAYYEDRISYEFLFNKFKKEHRFEDFTKVSKKDFQKIIMLAWGTMYAMCLGDKAGCCKASCIHNQL